MALVVVAAGIVLRTSTGGSGGCKRTLESTRCATPGKVSGTFPEERSERAVCSSPSGQEAPYLPPQKEALWKRST